MAVRTSGPGDRPFVGRARELSVAAEILTDPDRAGVILIGGESGLGKTRLAREIAAKAPDSTTVILGGAVPRQTPIPFELARSARTPSPDGASAAADADRNTDADPADRIRAEAEALRVDDGPTIYVFEDVHWADAESLEVIDRLVVAGPLGASIIITYRPNGLHPGHPTSGFLQRVERRAHVARFRLEPLRREEIRVYLAANDRPVDAATVEHVHGRTGGNPLLLSELVAATAADADLTAGLPWTLAEMLRPEIERLDQGLRSVAEAVAVLGADVAFELLAAAVDVSEAELLKRLRSLVDLRILVESGPDRFGFRHDMVREAVADGLFTREHRRIHGTVHDALVAAGSDDVVALVTHATGAGRTKEAADAARDAAGHALERGHTHQAFAFAEQALLEHTDDIGLLRVAVVSGWMAGLQRAALHHLDRWDELVGSISADRAEVLHHRIRLLYEEGDQVGCERAFDELTTLAGELPDGPVRAQAFADLAQHLMLSARYDDAVAAADRAIEIAGMAGPEADGAARQARAERASVLAYAEPAGRPSAIRELLTVAAEASAAGDHLVASRAIHNIPLAHPDVVARDLVERMRKASERAGLSCMATDTYRHHVLSIAMMEGDRDAFEAQLQAAVDELGHIRKIETMTALAALDAGRFDEVLRVIDRLGNPDVETVHVAAALRAMRSLLADGDVEPVRRWFGEAPTGPKPSDFGLELVLVHLSDLLEADLGQELAAFIDRHRAAVAFEPAYLGMAAELEGRPDDAERTYARALTEGMCRTVFDLAEIDLARARLAPAVGADPRPHLESAAERLCRWPGRRLTRVETLLDNPVRPRPTSVLTGREREVAELVARGLTNGGIADELFISTKTASVHVSNILAKLHMSSRTEIASWVTAGGLDG